MNSEFDTSVDMRTTMLAIQETVYDQAWYPDSSASNNVTPEPENLLFRTTSFHFPNSPTPLLLHNLIHVPKISKNI